MKKNFLKQNGKPFNWSKMLLLCAFLIPAIGIMAQPVHNVNQNTNFPSIQPAINAANPGDVIEVSPGTYIGNVLINKQNLTLRSTGGRGVTTIQGVNAANTGTIAVSNGINGVTIGGPGQGFHIVGIDGSGPGESAAIYLLFGHANITIEGNEIQANGDHGLLSAFGGPLSNITINNNIFSGQTFVGANPGGCGFGTQFDPGNNVPRQLVTLGSGAGVTNAFNIVFTNNQITGTAGGFNGATGCTIFGQGNNLVTIDVNSATISGNDFNGVTTRFGNSLRCRGRATSISCNTFHNTGLGAACGNITFGNNGNALVGATPSTLAGVASSNAFPGGGAYLTPNNAATWTIYRDMAQATATATSVGAGQTAVACATSLGNASASNNGPLCVGGTLNLTAAGGSSYSWTGPNAFSSLLQNPTISNVTSLEAGIYTVTVTGVGGCPGFSGSASTTVVVNPLPVVTAANVSGCAGSAIALSGSPSGGTFSVSDPYTGPSTTYTYSYTDVNGCSNTSSNANITVNPLPVVTAGDVSGCAGTAIALSGSPSGGTFSEANPYTGPSTTYTYTYTDGNSCTNTSAAANITVYPQPVINAGLDVTVYYGYPPQACATLTATGQGINPVTWAPGGATTASITVCPIATTTYTVSTTTGNGCSSSDTVTVTVINVRCGKGSKMDKVTICHIPPSKPSKAKTQCVSQNAVAAHLAHGDLLGPCPSMKSGVVAEEVVSETTLLTVFPNPLISTSHIQFTVPSDRSIELKLINLTGTEVETIYSGLASADQDYHFTLNAEKLSSGVYFLKLQSSDGELKIEKLLIQK